MIILGISILKNIAEIFFCVRLMVTVFLGDLEFVFYRIRIFFDVLILQSIILNFFFD